MGAREATNDQIPAPGSSEAALPPRAALQAHFHHVLNLVQTHPQHFVVLNELVLRAPRDPEAARVLAEIDSGWRDYLVPLPAKHL